MKVNEVMTRNVEYLASDTTLAEAAQCMRDQDCGFLPIGDDPQGKLQGVITDRDIVVRAIAEGCDPEEGTIGEYKTDKVLYCYESDDVQNAARNMREQQVYRLIVLNNDREKRLCGVVTLGDIVRKCGDENLTGNAAKGITRAA